MLGECAEFGARCIRFAWALRPEARSHGLPRDAAATPRARMPPVAG